MEKDMPDINGWMFSSIAIFKRVTWLGFRIFDSSWGWLTPFWALVYKPTQSQDTADISSVKLVWSQGETWPCDNQDMGRCFPRKNMEQQEWWTNKYSASQWIWSISLTIYWGIGGGSFGGGTLDCHDHPESCEAIWCGRILCCGHQPWYGEPYVGEAPLCVTMIQRKRWGTTRNHPKIIMKRVKSSQNHHEHDNT